MAAESASEYEVEKDEKRNHNSSHKVSSRRQSSLQRNANSLRRPSKSRRSRVVMSSDDEEEEAVETDEDDEYLFRLLFKFFDSKIKFFFLDHLSLENNRRLTRKNQSRNLHQNLKKLQTLQLKGESFASTAKSAIGK